jgi:hypothetical protein
MLGLEIPNERNSSESLCEDYIEDLKQRLDSFVLSDDESMYLPQGKVIDELSSERVKYNLIYCNYRLKGSSILDCKRSRRIEKPQSVKNGTSPQINQNFEEAKLKYLNNNLAQQNFNHAFNK